MANIYLIGSLRNSKIIEIASKLRQAGHEVFDDWYAAGPEADDYWQKYEITKGNNYKQGLAGYAANHVYEFDKFHLDRNDIGILALPAGKSGHLELGYMIGKGKLGYILFDEAMPADRWDVMYLFAAGVFFNLDSLIEELKDK
jgi:nucleoside 2-deoxyribosyltransferase